MNKKALCLVGLMTLFGSSTVLAGGYITLKAANAPNIFMHDIIVVQAIGADGQPYTLGRLDDLKANGYSKTYHSPIKGWHYVQVTVIDLQLPLILFS